MSNTPAEGLPDLLRSITLECIALIRDYLNDAVPNLLGHARTGAAKTLITPQATRIRVRLQFACSLVSSRLDEGEDDVDIPLVFRAETFS